MRVTLRINPYACRLVQKENSKLKGRYVVEALTMGRGGQKQRVLLFSPRALELGKDVDVFINLSNRIPYYIE